MVVSAAATVGLVGDAATVRSGEREHAVLAANTMTIPAT
jgi:hypothetical protein